MPSALTVAEVRELDRFTIEEVGLPGRLLMETAGFGAFCILIERLAPDPASAPVLVAAGKGNNAGDGFVVARFLASQSLPVRVACVSDPLQGRKGSDAWENARLLAAYGVTIESLTSDNAAALCQASRFVALGSSRASPIPQNVSSAPAQASSDSPVATNCLANCSSCVNLARLAS